MAETNPLLADFVAAYDGLHPLLEAWLQHAPCDRPFLYSGSLGVSGRLEKITETTGNRGRNIFLA